MTSIHDYLADCPDYPLDAIIEQLEDILYSMNYKRQLFDESDIEIEIILKDSKTFSISLLALKEIKNKKRLC